MRVHSEEPVRLTLKKTGEGKVKAKDIQANSEVEIANPELHLATITDEAGELEMEIIVSRGRGFVTTEDRGKEKEIGVIAIDSIFTPVRNVGYQVVDTRVGQITNFDKLILNVETDGTITAKDAIEQATKLLIEHFELLRDLSGKEGAIPAEFVSEEPAAVKEEASADEEPKKAKKKKSE
jgi:DNA-directed RNA polymerase subunit alpha